MRVLDFIILRIFLLQIFFFNYVYARYPLVSSAYVEFKEQWLADCGSITYIPLTPPKKNCDKEDNPFRGAHIEEMEENERKKCKKPQDSNSSLFDKNILHDVLFLCRHDEICDDLAEEIVIVKVWNRIVNQKPFENKCGDIFEYNQYKCPFTSRIDIQEYVQKNEIKKNLNYNELCTDKYGRTYPPPVGLGGKCVMFQREYPENGELVTEVIMPLDKRDMVERISQLPKDHELRTNETTLERFFPNGDTETSDDSTCMSLHVNKEAFIHCVYAPGDSDSFYLSSRTHFFCPKNISVTKSFLQSHLKSSLLGYEDEAKYETRNIDEGKFEFSEYCYIATDFTPTVLPDDDVRIELVAKFVGSKQSECNEKQIIEAKNGTSKEDYGKKLLESIGEFCPWENNTTYTICFKTKSEHYSSLYVEALNTMASVSAFQSCHYQVAIGACYYQINLTDGSTSRVPSQWIAKIESGTLNATKTYFKDEVGCGIVFITAEMKERCYKKSNKIMEEYSTGSNVVICKCTTSSCDAPHIENDFVLDIYRNTVVCNQGSAETILPSPSFYCYVRLTVESENGKNVKIFNYSFIDQNIPYEMDLYKCWSYQNLYEKMTDSEVHEAEITTCFHDIDAETFECCCLASHKPCNSREIIETYYKMVNQEAKDKESRTQIGCNFTTNVLTEETCKNDVVQNDREMKCYGVFKIPSTRKNSKALKPILVKENCYWPHPQYYDQYSVFCSKPFFDIVDLVENKCITLFINDFTSSLTTPTELMEEEKKMDKTLIICCNTGVYPEKRESILSRSINVL